MTNKRMWTALALLALTLAWCGGGEAPAVTAAGDAQVPQQRLVALTFDDGPRRSTTTRLLDALAERGAQATFFLVGECVNGQEELVRRMEAEGHQIGTHSYDHVRLTDLSAADFARQVDRTELLLTDILGHGGFALRPPYGSIDNGVEKRADSPLILWSVDPEDWKYRDADKVAQHIIQNARDGDIILLHDIYSTSVDAAIAVVDALHQEGFLFVTVDELAQQRQTELKPGQCYRSFPP